MDNDQKEPNLYYEAFKEQYNLIALFGVAGLAIVTGSWLPLVAGLVGEAAYVLFFSESGFYKRMSNLRRWKKQKQDRQKELERTVLHLPDHYRERCEDIFAARDRIVSLAARPEVQGLFLTEEIGKLEYLYQTFVRFADLVVHYRRYLHDIPEESIENDLRRIEGQLGKSSDQRTRAILEKNRGILAKRKTRRDALVQHVKSVEAQLEVIENTFRLVNEQMLTMKEPSEISGDLDDLISGVEMTAEVVKESSSYLDDLRRMQAIGD